MNYDINSRELNCFEVGRTNQAGEKGRCVLKKKLATDLAILAKQCLIALRTHRDDIDDDDNTIATLAACYALQKLADHKFFWYFHHIAPEDEADLKSLFEDQTDHQHLSQDTASTQPQTDAQRIRRNKEKAIAKQLSPLLAAIAPVITYEEYNHLQKTKQEHKLRKEMENEIRNRNEDTATQDIEAIMIDNDIDKTEAIKDIIRTMTNKHTERLTIVENRLKKMQQPQTNTNNRHQQRKNGQQRDTATNNRQRNNNKDTNKQGNKPSRPNSRTPTNRGRSRSTNRHPSNRRSRTPARKVQFNKSAIRNGKFNTRHRNDRDDTNNDDRSDSKKRSSRHTNQRRSNNNRDDNNTHRNHRRRRSQSSRR